MINNNFSAIPSFVSQAQLFVPLMHSRLSQGSNRKININKSLFARKPFIVHIEEPDADYITLEHFLALLDIRINAEFAYRNEIIQLKDNLCEEFNKLCDGVTDKDFIKFVRDQRQRMISVVINETKIEQKMIAEQFYNDMVNGWDEKALDLEEFDKTVYAVLWKPLLTPFPIEALDKLRELIKEEKYQRSTLIVEKIATTMVEHITIHMEAKNIRDSSFETTEELKIVLEEASKKRKVYNIEVGDITTSENVISEFAKKCVAKVTLALSDEELLTNELSFNYDGLKLIGKIEEVNIKNIFDKVQRRITELNMSFENNNIGEEGAIAVSTALKELKNISILHLNFQYSDIRMNGTKSISAALGKLKNIMNLNLNLWGNNIGDEGAKLVSAALKELKNISILHLNLEYNFIEKQGAKAFSLAFKELKNIFTLNLDFRANNIGAKGVKAISVALGELKYVLTLVLDFQDNNIEAEGATALADSLKKLKNISSLDLNLSDNNMEKEGAKAISTALAELKSTSTLKLNLSNNNIGTDGTIEISNALKELKNISVLNLNLRDSMIGEEGTIAVSIALKELKRISILSLDIGNNNIRDEGAKAISAVFWELKNISVLNLSIWNNNIRDEGAKAVLSVLYELKNISTLDINFTGNEVGEEVEAMISKIKRIYSKFSIQYWI